ncbi:MAG: zf-HC2 domain-containing protein [Oscillospiraceae bacterium]|nr:zf-HC2 domain-containing protein [Oscillospiraceae bacterium]
MSCEGNFELVSVFMDGEMSDAERADAAEHIKNCPACRKILDDFTLMGDMIKGEEVSAPQGLHGAVMEQVIFRKTKKSTGKVKRYGYLAAACVLVVLAGVTHFTGGENSANLAADTAYTAGSGDYVYSAGEAQVAAPSAASPKMEISESTPSDDSFDAGATAPSAPSAPTTPSDAAGDSVIYDNYADSSTTEGAVLFSNQAFIAVQEGGVTQNARVYDLAAAEEAVREGEDDYVIVDGEEGPALVVSAEAYNSFVYATSNCISPEKAKSGWVMIYEEN